MVVILIASFILEISSGIAAGTGVMGSVLLPAFAAHWLGCALFAHSAVGLISHRFEPNRGGDAVLFFSLSFFVPLLGMFGLCSILPAFRHGRSKAGDPLIPYQMADSCFLPDSPPRPQIGPGPANPGILVSTLRHAPESSRRTAAILATLRLPDQDAINVLRVALGDTEDDIRLLAYALLAQLDKRHNDKIQAGIGQLRRLPPESRFRLHKQIAQQYWELAWVGLARGESVAPILKKAQEHAVAGLADCPSDAGLLLLHGKILLRLKRYDEAFDVFSSAESAGMDICNMAPYLAEISFFRRQFSGVVGHMERARLGLHSSLAVGVRDYWGERSYAA